jgi:hypothetical protein
MKPAERDARIKALKRTLRGMGPALETARARTKSANLIQYKKACRKHPPFRAHCEAAGAYVEAKKLYDEIALELAGLQEQARKAQVKAERRRDYRGQLSLFARVAA